MVDFRFAIIELFTYLLRLRRYKRKSVEVSVFRRECVTECNFRWKRTSPVNRCWYQQTTRIAISCGIKISAVNCFILSHSTRVTDRQNCDSYTALACIQLHCMRRAVKVDKRSTGVNVLSTVHVKRRTVQHASICSINETCNTPIIYINNRT